MTELQKNEKEKGTKEDAVCVSPSFKMRLCGMIWSLWIDVRCNTVAEQMPVKKN